MRILKAALVCALLGAVPGLAADKPPRNVLLLTIDTLRADHLSLYGYAKETTPRLAAFAADATTFRHAYSPSAWTRASFATYFTGLSPTVSGCRDQDDVLDPDLPTLAELFRARGFATAGIYSNDNIGPAFGFGRGFDLYDHPPCNSGYPDDFQVTDAADVNERALRWLREERPKKPWFLFVLYVDPHDPYRPHPEMGSHLPPRGEPIGSRKFLDRLDRATDGRLDHFRDDIVGLYDGEIAYVDRYVGELLDALKYADLLDDTLVIVTADHGEELWDHEGFRGHGRYLYDGEVHVPLVVRWPGALPLGGTIDRPVGVGGLFGTLARAYGLAEPAALAPGFLRDDGRSIPLELHAEGRTLRALLEWPWKLIREEEARDPATPSGRSRRAPPRILLYDLARDPGETLSLADSQPDRVRAMSARLAAIAAADSARHAAMALEERAPQLSDREKRNLRALGYVR